jgi:hypothetical protein
LGVTLVPARKEADALAQPDDREASGRRFGSGSGIIPAALLGGDSAYGTREFSRAGRWLKLAVRRSSRRRSKRASGVRSAARLYRGN